jgi:hypothetical protein
VTGKPNENGRPHPRAAARPEPHKATSRTLTPRSSPTISPERAAQPVRPRTGPPRPRGVR